MGVSKNKLLENKQQTDRAVRAAKSRLTSAADKKASKKANSLNQDQLNQLILDHRENGRKIARSILKKWHVRMPTEDIDSIVDLTLCEAGSRFSLEHGASFMTFVFYHLRGNLVRAVAKASQATGTFIQACGDSNLAITEWDPEINSEKGFVIITETEAFGNREIKTPEQSMITEEDATLCREACEKLDELQRIVITKSFEGDQSLVDIAKELGYSRCHISRIRTAALKVLKKHLSKSGSFKKDSEIVELDQPLLRSSPSSRKINKKLETNTKIERISADKQSVAA